jgi:hypothetical protein
MGVSDTIFTLHAGAFPVFNKAVKMAMLKGFAILTNEISVNF